VHEHSEKRLRAILPLFEQSLAADAANVHPVIRARDGVEAGGIDDNVELKLTLCCL
jgi:hypothetical protein